MQHHLIAGEEAGRSDETLAVHDPATGEVVEEALLGGAEHVEAAVASASEAASNRRWAEDGRLRSRVLYRWAERIEAETEDLALLLTRENGKLLSESKAELAAAADTVRFAAGQARMLEGRSLTLGPGVYGQITFEPVGVVGVIGPWNWPVLLALRELAPVLAAGNAAVVKPALEAPLTLMRVLGLALEDPDLPAGVINAVVGSGSVVGERLVSHPDVPVISFTGSVETGKMILRSSAEHVKKVVLELGGKSPSIVFEDADLDRALPVLSKFTYGTAGQNCMAATRILVQDGIFDEVRRWLTEIAEGLKVGPGTVSDSQMGPVISEKQLDSIHTAVQEGAASGGELTAGGERLEDGSLRSGCFYAPTILSDLPRHSPAVQKEIFGPVLSLERFRDEDEACESANGTSYGLVASVWTENHNRAERVARRIEAGTVWINTYLRMFPEAESGGMKESGLGRSRGRAGIEEYMEIKHILSDVTEE
jgi:betaine-aldehyde dehydrogenase